MQLQLFDIQTSAKFPTTRYQGSKLKYIDWIMHCTNDLSFDTVLDAFGGTGSVAYRFKQNGKKVVYNDILKFNSIIGKALIENDSIILDDYEVDLILKEDKDTNYPNFIQNTFQDIYYTDEENKWLDIVLKNIQKIDNTYKKAIAYFALFQACIIKRPYNLFHRKNLYIRTQEVKRTFGNKKTWDTPFETHFRNFVNEANNAIFSNKQNNIAINKNIFDVNEHFDLVYIDTPYISEKGIGTDYHGFYHFLEGMINYDEWERNIDYNSKHKKLLSQKSAWTKSDQIEDSFDKLIDQFKSSILLISYRSDGIPSIENIQNKLERIGKKVTLYQSKDMKYVLSNKQSNEVLLLAQ